MGSKQKIVFLVDDDMTNLTVGKKALADNYKVLTFNSGVIMLETIENIKPDLILLDINMPKMDGYEVLKRIRELDYGIDIPVIFLTALNDKSSIMEGLSLGPSDYITKPFLPPHLLERVQAHLA